MPGLEGRWWMIVILLIIVMIIWGPGKLPEVGAGMGKAYREFRKAISGEPTDVSAPAAKTTPPAETKTPPDATPSDKE